MLRAEQDFRDHIDQPYHLMDKEIDPVSCDSFTRPLKYLGLPADSLTVTL